MMIDSGLKDKVLLITGANHGIGAATAKAFAAQGAKVFISYYLVPCGYSQADLEKARQKSPDAIRVIITAYTGEELLMDAVNRVHAHGFVPKPWVPERMKDNQWHG